MRCAVWIVAGALALGGGSKDALAATIGGRTLVESFAYPDGDSASPTTESFFAVELESRAALARDVTLAIDARAVADDAEFTAGAYEPRNGGRRRPYLSLPTAVLHYRPAPGLRLSAGRQVFNWSAVDEIEPANLLAPADQSDPFRPEKTGALAVSLRVERALGFAELAIVPMTFAPARSPQGRWRLVPAELRERQDLPPVAANETQAGLRLGTRWSEVEIVLLGYVGRDFLPQFELGTLPGTASDVEIVATYPRIRCGGFLLSAPIGETLLGRSEIVFFSSPDPTRDDFLHATIGLEAALGDWHLNLVYLRDGRVARAPQRPLDAGQRRFFQSFLFGEIRHDTGRRIAARLRGGFDFTGRFLILQPEVTVDLGYDLVFALSGDLVHATGDSYFSRIRHEDRIGGRLEHHFDACDAAPAALQSVLGCSR